jgi:regulator of protease activity HflC (stomatin/prohibitin superfamily)
MTQEGISVTCNADISFKIDDGDQKPTLETPHPMTEEAVFKAATSKWIREAWRTEPDRLMTWTKQVIIGETEGTLRSILARYPLDQLIDPAVRRKIQAELEEKLRGAVPNLGAKITRVALGDIQLEDEVTQQWIEKWQAEGRRRMMELEAEGQAARAAIEANARIQAQVKMIANTAKAFASMAKYGEEIPSRFVILRFIEMIKRTSVEMLGKLYLPYDVMRTFQMLEGSIKGHRRGETRD